MTAFWGFPISFNRTFHICFRKVMIRVGLMSIPFNGLEKILFLSILDKTGSYIKQGGCINDNGEMFGARISVSKIGFYASVCDILTWGVCIRGVKIVWTWHAWVSSRINVEYLARVVVGVCSGCCFWTNDFNT